MKHKLLLSSLYAINTYLNGTVEIYLNALIFPCIVAGEKYKFVNQLEETSGVEQVIQHIIRRLTEQKQGNLSNPS